MLTPEARKLVESVPKFVCHGCDGAVSRIVDSRYRGEVDAVIRVRQCKLCGERFETAETFRRRV